MSKKQLYFEFSDGGEMSKVVTLLDTCIDLINSNDLDKKDEEELKEITFTIRPVLLTERQYRSLKDANF